MCHDPPRTRGRMACERTPRSRSGPWLRGRAWSITPLTRPAPARYDHRVRAFPSLVGVIHLPPLPGSPRSELTIDEITLRAAADARALADAGFHAIIVENFGDVPFFPRRVPHVTVAAMTACVRAVCDAVDLPVGVNVLRNDGSAALAVAVASRASFIRVNVNSGVKVTDQGMVESQAHLLLRERSALAAHRVAIWCDVDVKHAAPLGERSLGDEAEDLVERELADAVLVTGRGTGKAVDLAHLDAVRARTHVPVLAASGVTVDSLASTLRRCSGVIVGSALRQDGRAGFPLDQRRIAAFVEAYRKAGERS
jgi:membrane complex biogenesis BtpA family protein